MYPNENRTNKKDTTNKDLPLPEVLVQKNNIKNPPGVELPPETEMSPAQFG